MYNIVVILVAIIIMVVWFEREYRDNEQSKKRIGAKQIEKS